MNDNNQEPKFCPVCPLLSVADPEAAYADCIGSLCAWYIQNRPPFGDGYCAVAKLAAIGGIST